MRLTVRSYAAVVMEMPAPARVRTAEELYGYGSAFAEYEAFEAALDHGGRAEHRAVHPAGRGMARAGPGGRRQPHLPHVSRLLRNRPAYRERFGANAYDAIPGNCL
jgi:hypothetical protein